MGMEALAPNLPPIPDLATVAEVIGLAAAAESERFEQRPSSYPRYDLDDGDRPFRPTPACDALLAYLRGLPDEAVAGLFGLYHAGDLPRTDRGKAEARYRSSLELAMMSIHRPHGAHDLAAKGPLADGLRRGLEHLGLRLEASRAGTTSDNVPRTA